VDIRQARIRIKTYQSRFIGHFKTKTRNVIEQSKKYLLGCLTVSKRGTMVEMSKTVPNCNNQSIQHFISNSLWDEQGLIYQIQDDVADLIGDKENGSLQLDESGFPKQGENSAGVKRQYCGKLGKIDNCQVGVFLGYVNDSKRILFDKRLYIPKDWMNDTERKKKCGIPDDLIFKTKAELGLEMILEAKKRNIPFGWVGMDSFYGEQPWLLNELDEKGVWYIADIPCDSRVWLNKPIVGIPQKNGVRGRNPTIEKVVSPEDPLRVDKLVNDLDSLQWHRVFLRDSERKEMWCKLACLRVYPVNNSLPGKECWLIIRRNEGENDTKYQFSNAPLETSIEKLGQMSCSRYWIERALEDAKGDGGLADYEVRGYIGWNHHIAMVFMAMLFLLEMQDEWKLKAPLLTLTDVREIFEVIMPKRRVSDREILKLIEQKHKARYSAKLSHHKKGR
jgi:SRSO17 transposase